MEPRKGVKHRPPRSTHRRLGNSQHVRNRKAVRGSKVTLATGCGGTKIFLLPSKSELCRMIPHSAVCLRSANSYSGSSCSTSRTFRRSNSFAC